MSGRRIVTVDGTAGSGKSTLGRALALEFALPLIDTGLFYRGMMVAAVRAGVDGRDADALARLAQATVIDVPTDPDSHDGGVAVDGVPAGAMLRDPRHAPLLAAISSNSAVRAAVLDPQRALAVDGAVAVGRDCGTVVFPHAAVKFYLQAPESVRQQRRLDQLRAGGSLADDRMLRAEVGDRDRADTDRTESPLRPAEDAHLIDTAAMDVAAMVAHALRICRDAGFAPPSRE
ncbi:MAG TPA: (d)CMP kinase [Candidatus Dormibacteraeota bacterium]|jgi:cytidylate kinase|nr:(d)CMP kinase [Candidatus Dormibacteraeota bacterium]